MIRDLMEQGVQLVREEQHKAVAERAGEMAEERLLDLLLPSGGSTDRAATREKLRGMLRAGGLEERSLELDVQERATGNMQIFSNQGLEEMGINLQEMLGNLPFGKRTKKRRMKVPEARRARARQGAGKPAQHATGGQSARARGAADGHVL